MNEEAIRGRGYEILKKERGGRFTIVYRAYQSNVGREVAIKVNRSFIANDPYFISRFKNEARITSQLVHPYIVPLCDFWQDDNQPYIVLRWITGGNLRDALLKGPLDPKHVVQIVKQVASALDTAHKHGIVHCAVKPSNIMLDEFGNAYLTDFGVAEELGSNPDTEGEGINIGSLYYIAPEQITGDAVSPQSDLYCLGCVIYNLLTGEPVYSHNDIVTALCSHLYDSVPSVIEHCPNMQAAVDVVLQKATAKNPVDRYSDAISLAEEFEKSINCPELDMD